MIKRNPQKIKRNYEVWKPIKGFPDYAISNFGRVRSLERYVEYTDGRICLVKEKILKSNPLSTGYLLITLCREKMNYSKVIHTLVLTHFGPPKPSPEHECNHIDGDKTNNWWTNLEWMTHAENIKHAFYMGLAIGKIGEKNGRSKLTEKEVKSIRNEYVPRKVTLRFLAGKYGVHKAAIEKIVKHLTWKNIA